MSWTETTTVQVEDVRLDPCLVGLPLTITHGRASPNNQPDAPVCTFTYLGDEPPQLGHLVRVQSAYPNRDPGTWLDERFTWVDTGTSWLGSTVESDRFVGRVSQVTAVEELGTVVGWQLVCTGVMAELGHRKTVMSRPRETDVVRVSAILASTGMPYLIRGTDTRELAEDDIDRDTLSALTEICSWTGALLYQRRDGTIIYGTTYHRDEEPSAVLPCEVLGDGIGWVETTDQIINRVVVKFVRPSGEVQQTYNDTASQLVWGLQEVEIGTKLWETAADEFGNMILARRAQPKWTLPGTLYTDWTRNTDVQERAMLSVDVSDTVLLPISPVPGDVPAPVSPWTVEGWIEVIDSTGRYSQLSVTDISRYSARSLRTWDMMRAESWQHWLDHGSWRDLLVKVGT